MGKTMHLDSVILPMLVSQQEAPRGNERAVGGGGRSITIQTGVIDTTQTTTTETRETTETVDTTTLEQTTTTTTETEFTTETQTTTTTATTTTVNRISGEHTVREIVGQKVFDLVSIPWMRSRKVSFRGDGLRPNTRYFPFFDNTDVSAFCIATNTFVRHSDRNPETRTTNLAPEVKHSGQNSGNELLISDTNGQLNGEFEIPNNSAMRFQTGTKNLDYTISVNLIPMVRCLSQRLSLLQQVILNLYRILYTVHVSLK